MMESIAKNQMDKILLFDFKVPAEIKEHFMVFAEMSRFSSMTSKLLSQNDNFTKDTIPILIGGEMKGKIAPELHLETLDLLQRNGRIRLFKAVVHMDLEKEVPLTSRKTEARLLELRDAEDFRSSSLEQQFDQVAKILVLRWPKDHLRRLNDRRVEKICNMLREEVLNFGSIQAFLEKFSS